ncbi:MAG: TCR/Tet family MFS transporter [Pseudomonadota bacterium]
MTQISAATPRRAAVIFIFITVVLDVLAFGIIIPVLPQLVVEFMHGDTASAASIYGIFGAAWALMQFVFSPLLGMVSDRYGRRPVILLSCFGLGLDYVFMALAPTLWWLFLGRIISGITAASFSTAGAYIADVTPAEKRASAFGMIGAAWGLGFIVGPAIGGLLGAVDPRMPFWGAAALALINAAYGFFVLPESLAPENRTGFSWKKANPVGALKLLRSHPELSGLSIVNALFAMAHHVLPSTFVLYAGYRYGWDTRTVGLMLALTGVCNVIVQAVLIKPVVARLGERKAILLGLLAGALGFLIYGTATTGWWFVWGTPVFSLMGLFGPAAQGMMTRRVSASEQGQLQGANSSIMGITGIIAPALFTQTFAFFIATHRSWELPGAPFILAALLMVVALLLAVRVTRPTESPELAAENLA